MNACRSIACRAAAAACGLWVAVAAARADRVVLRNGNEIEGVVTEDRGGRVVLEIGGGTMTLERSRVREIRRDTAEANEELRTRWRKTFFLHPRHVPADLKPLAAAVQNLSGRRAGALDARRAVHDAAGTVHRMETEAAALQSRLADASRALVRADPNSQVAEYNRLVRETNASRAALTVNQNERRKIEEARERAEQVVSRYLADLARLEGEFERAGAAVPETEPSSAHAVFLERVRTRLAELNRDCARVEVAAVRENGGTIVTALINDSESARLVLDTGAAQVTLSEDLARRLKLSIESLPSGRVVLADGSRAEARFAILGSIRLGDARVEHVPAVVLPRPANENVDGLLGMSFLRHFVMKLDGATGKLVLVRLEGP